MSSPSEAAYLPAVSAADRVAERARQMQWRLEFDGEPQANPETVEELTPPAAAPGPRPSVGRDRLPLDQILCGDNLALIRALPDESVHLVVTSPPYYQQRDYNGLGIGSEETVEDYVAQLVTLFRECVRVITPDGSLVFNLGDKYQKSSLLLVPYRFALAATETGLARLVNTIAWVKQNPTPRQFRRRLVSSHEPFFHFVKTDGYFYNLDDFNEDGPHKAKKAGAATAKLGQSYFRLIAESDLPEDAKAHARAALHEVIREAQEGKIAGFRMKIRGIHAEAFGGQEGGRKTQMLRQGFTIIRLLGHKIKRDVIETPVETVKGCPHPAIYPVEVVSELLRLLTQPDDIVLDPFMGSGSTAVACHLLGRRYLGFDINPAYCDYARRRVAELRGEQSDNA